VATFKEGKLIQAGPDKDQPDSTEEDSAPNLVQFVIRGFPVGIGCTSIFRLRTAGLIEAASYSFAAINS
jgi:hypothetical protein